MLLGYTRVSKADGSQALDLQKDALLAAGVAPGHIYEDRASGRCDDRPGRDLRHLVNTVHDLTARGVGLKVLTGQAAAIDTTTPAGKLVFGIFAALAEYADPGVMQSTCAKVYVPKALYPQNASHYCSSNRVMVRVSGALNQ